MNRQSRASAIGKKALGYFDFVANPMAITILKDGTYLYVNPAFQGLLGYPPTDVLDRTSTGLGIIDFAERDILVKKLCETGYVHGYPVTLKTATGELREVIFYLDIVTYDKKKCILATYTDITHVKRLEREVTRLGRISLIEELAGEEQLFNQLIEKAPIGVILCNGTGIILYCNGMCREYFGDYVGDPTGQHISVLQNIGVRALEELYILQALKGQEYINKQIKLVGLDWVMSSFPLFNQAGEIVAAASLTQEITPMVRLQQEISRLDRLNLIGQMAAGVAHEIRNPMTVVKGYLQYLQRKVPEYLQQQFESALHELSAVENLITDFLSLAKNNSVAGEVVSINEIIREITPLIMIDAIKSSVSVHHDLQEDLPPQVLSIKEIKQVLYNLTRNAIDAMPRGGDLLIRTFQEKDLVVLTVADTGEGIPVSQLGKIFDPFFTTKPDGSGLGLAICENIVKNHGGTIEVESQPDKGTVFTLRLPYLNQQTV